MARKVFFSFHFKRDAWRAAQVRNADLLSNADEYGVIDSVEWEKIEREGDEAVKRWINSQLKHTSVTVVLIGAETAERDWIDYEIRQSWDRGNAILGLRIHKVKHHNGETDVQGHNPLDEVHLVNGNALSSICKTYDWVSDDGRSNLGTWVEEAFQARAAYDGETELIESLATKGNQAGAMRNSGPTIITSPAKPWAA
jgi:hypothetical protein